MPKLRLYEARGPHRTRDRHFLHQGRSPGVHGRHPSRQPSPGILKSNALHGARQPEPPTRIEPQKGDHAMAEQIMSELGNYVGSNIFALLLIVIAAGW